MKKLVLSFMTLIIILSPLTALADNVIIIAGDENYPPYEYIDADNDYVGFNIDIMKAISLDMGVSFKIIPMDWMEAHKKLLDGDIDAIQGMSFNKERKKIYSFSQSYLEDELMIFTLKSNNKIYSLENLKGKKVAVQRHGLGAYILSDLGEVEVDFTDDLEKTFKLLEMGKIDAILANKASALHIIKSMKIEQDIGIVADNIASMPYGVAFKKGNDELINDFNTSLNNIKNNGTYQKIYNKWFGDITDLKYQRSQKIIYILSIILICIILIGLIIIRFNSKLKQEVKKRTREIEQNKKELLESYIYRDQIIKSMGSGIIILSTEGFVLDINPQAEKILNLKLGNEIDLHYKDSTLTDYIDIDIIESSILGQNSFNSLEKETIINDKELFYAYDIYPFLDYDENNIGTLIMIKDLTEISKLRKNLVQKDKLESLGFLTSSIAHEIRNPLTAIKSYIDILPIKYDNERFRDKITTQLPVEIDRLNNLLTDLLEYSKPKQFKKEWWNLYSKISDIKAFLSPNLEAKNIDFLIELDRDIEIYSDRHQIKQVIINIILNSIDAVDTNGFIKIRASETEEYHYVSIIDNGCGIDEDKINKVMDPFYTTKSNGTGLGLSTAFIIMKENEGYIEINNIDNGSKVTLVFKKF